MKTHCQWTGNLQFITTMENHSVVMDAKKPIGTETAPTPKDLLVSALCGCTAMDVVSLMRKHKQPLEGFSIEAETRIRATHPAIFTEINLIYRLKGALDQDRVIEAVRLSESQYCSVSAMLARVVPITYRVELNGVEVDRGQANFEIHLGEANQGIV